MEVNRSPMGAALHAESWASIIEALDVVDNQIVRREEPAPYGARIYVAEAELRNERELARALSIGFAAKGFSLHASASKG